MKQSFIIWDIPFVSIQKTSDFGPSHISDFCTIDAQPSFIKVCIVSSHLH